MKDTYTDFTTTTSVRGTTTSVRTSNGRVMWQYMLILLCLQSQVIHATKNGDQIVNHVEKKSMERKAYLVYNIVKRAVGANDIDDVDMNKTGTTQVPSNVVDYISPEHTGQDSTVSVQQLEGTTESISNATANTEHTTTAKQIKQTTSVNNNVTETRSNISSSTQISTNDSMKETIAPTRSISSSTQESVTTTKATVTTEKSNNTNVDTFTKNVTTVVSTSTSSTVSSVSTVTFSANVTDDLEYLPMLNTTVSSVSSVTATTRVTDDLESLPTPNTTVSGSDNILSTTNNSVEHFTTQFSNEISTSPSGITSKGTSSSSSTFVTSQGKASTSLPAVDNSTLSSETSTQLSTRSLPIIISTSSTSTQASTSTPFATTSRPTLNTPFESEGENHSEPETTSTTMTTNPTTSRVNESDSVSDTPLSEPEPTPTPEETPIVNTTTPGNNNDSSVVESEPNGNKTTPEPTKTTTKRNVTSTIPPIASTTNLITVSKTQPPQPETQSTTVTTKASATPTLESETSRPEPEEYTPIVTPGTVPPTAEPETYTSSPEPETESPTSEPEDSSSTTDAPTEAEPEFNFDVFAEPGPDWPVAKLEWKLAWEFHIYFVGVAFVLLGLYCLFCVIQLWKMDHLLSRHYFMTLQVLVMVICIFRASYLLIDAYNSSGTFPVVLDYFLYSTVFPCLTAVFSILFHALLLAIRVRVISEKVQKLWVLLLIIGFHFALSFATDILVGLFSTAAVMLLICQSFFILWGLIIFIGYLVIFKRLYKSAINRQEALRRNSTLERKNNITQGFQEKLPKQKYRLGLAVRVTLVSSFFGLACVCFELYGMLGVYGVMREEKPKPWPWWIYHFIVRCLEIAMCSSIAYVASQPLKYTYKKKYKDRACLKALPCRYLCYADISSHRDEGNVSLDQYAVSETDHLGWLKKIKLKKFSSPDASAPYPPHTAEKYSDPDATLLVRKINKPRPSMLVVEDGFVRIKRDDEMIPENQYDIDNASRSSRSSDINNASALPGASYTVNETQRSTADRTRPSEGVANAGFAQEDNRISFQDDIRMSFPGDIEHENDIADETDVDIAVTDCENSDGYDTPVPLSDDNLGNSGDIFRPLSDIDLAASMESELERAFHPRYGDESDTNQRNVVPNKKVKSYKKSLSGSELNGQSHTDDDWSDSSDGPSRTPESGLLRRPIRRCKSAESKEEQRSRTFDQNKYFSLSSMDSVGKNEVPSTEL